MDRNFSPARSSRRMVPRTSVTAAICRAGVPIAYGIVTNLSESGACVTTTAALPLGGLYLTRISFPRQAELFEATARIVWSRDGYKLSRNLQGLLLHGMQFFHLTPVQRRTLIARLDTDAEFQLTYSPPFSEFDDLRADLQEFLDELGGKLRRSTGESD